MTLCTAHYLTDIRTTTDKLVGGLIDSHKETHRHLQRWKLYKNKDCKNEETIPCEKWLVKLKFAIIKKILTVPEKYHKLIQKQEVSYGD